MINSTAEEHMEHRGTVFDRLQLFGIVLNPSKCVFGVPSLEFLGYLADSHVMYPLPLRVAAIRDFPPPSSKRQLQRFDGCTRISSTAYHPVATGMAERSHRQLKASLRAADDPENWTDPPPPLVPLGIRFSLKSDLHCSAAELVFGATTRLPDQMIPPTLRIAVEEPTDLLNRLRPYVSESYLEKDLATCSHVYFPCDRVRRTLESPYDGSYLIISRGIKDFRIQRVTREEVLSMDHLEAAVLNTPPDEPCGPLPPAPSFRFPILYSLFLRVRCPYL
ncbi:hypothetical protein SprV_0200935900 [Sparganum proliferum]